MDPAVTIRAGEAIAVRNLSRSYATRDGRVATLERITFGVAEGEFIAVVEPSGCGKVHPAEDPGRAPARHQRRDAAARDADHRAPARPQGIRAKVFYTAYQGNIHGIAVPADSPVQEIADLKGKNVGVISMASGGVIVARALVAAAGLELIDEINRFDAAPIAAEARGYKPAR